MSAGVRVMILAGDEWSARQGSVSQTTGRVMVTLPSATLHFYNGRLHRGDGLPAVVRMDGSREWHQHGLLHRYDAPAATYPGGCEVWAEDGVLHRDLGPAVVAPGIAEFWIHGQRMSADEWAARTA